MTLAGELLLRGSPHGMGVAVGDSSASRGQLSGVLVTEPPGSGLAWSEAWWEGLQCGVGPATTCDGLGATR